MIYINGRFLLQELTGVNRFAYELCSALAKLGEDFVLLCPHGPLNAGYDVSSFRIRRCGRGQSHLWEQLALPLVFRRIKGDKLLICFTGLGPIAVKRKVTTIHDLAFMVNPRWYSRSYVFLYKWLTPLSARTSRRIITVSHFSKSEIARLLPVDEAKISVVYNAAAAFFRPLSDRPAPADRYILAVSSIDPRKNFATLLKAFALLDDTDIKLYIVGGQNRIYSTSVAELADSIPTQKIKWLGRVSDEELRTLYANAACFVYPSVYEGFGIPPLEAMACGTPVVVSDIPPIREVCGDAALYFNPLDEHDIASQIKTLVTAPALQEEMRAKGYVRYRQFDWEKSALMLRDIIHSV